MTDSERTEMRDGITYSILYLFERDVLRAESGQPVRAEHLRFGKTKARAVRNRAFGAHFPPLYLDHLIARADALLNARERSAA